MSNIRRGNNLSFLIHLDPYSAEDREKFDGDAVIEAVRQNPSAAATKYEINFQQYYYPLHQVIALRANVHVVEAVYNSYPQAIREECHGETALLHSVIHCAPTEVVSFLISKWPDAVRLKDIEGNTVLHKAVYYNAPYEVVLLLVNAWPGAAREKNCNSQTPLHWDVTDPNDIFFSLETVSLLVDCCCSDILKEKDYFGRTPLHCALCDWEVPLEVILFLLETWPEAIIEKDGSGMTPVDTYKYSGGKSEKAHQVLAAIHKLYSDNNKEDIKTLKEIANVIIQFKWRNGVLSMIQRQPTLVKGFDLDFRLLPDLLHVLGQHLTIKTTWKTLRNELDVMEGA